MVGWIFPSSKLTLMFISWRDLVRPRLWHIAYCPIHGNLDLLSHLLRYFIKTMTLIFVDHSSAWAFNHVSTWVFYCIENILAHMRPWQRTAYTCISIPKKTLSLSSSQHHHDPKDMLSPNKVLVSVHKLCFFRWNVTLTLAFNFTYCYRLIVRSVCS
jgi:hypothetical protein